MIFLLRFKLYIDHAIKFIIEFMGCIIYETILNKRLCFVVNGSFYSTVFQIESINML